MTDEKKPTSEPAKIADGPTRPIRMTGLPARIRLIDEDDPLSIRFVIEDYDVPEEGGDVLPFNREKE